MGGARRAPLALGPAEAHGGCCARALAAEPMALLAPPRGRRVWSRAYSPGNRCVARRRSSGPCDGGDPHLGAMLHVPRRLRQRHEPCRPPPRRAAWLISSRAPRCGGRPSMSWGSHIVEPMAGRIGACPRPRARSRREGVPREGGIDRRAARPRRSKTSRAPLQAQASCSFLMCAHVAGRLSFDAHRLQGAWLPHRAHVLLVSRLGAAASCSGTRGALSAAQWGLRSRRGPLEARRPAVDSALQGALGAVRPATLRGVTSPTAQRRPRQQQRSKSMFEPQAAT